MNLEKSINYIIEGTPVVDQIDALLEAEDRNDWSKIRRKLAIAIAATSGAAAGAYAYNRYFASRDCDSGITRFVAWVMKTSWNNLSKVSVNALTEAAGILATSVLGPQAGAVVRGISRKGFNILRRKVDKGVRPSKAEFLRAARQAVNDSMPAENAGKEKLKALAETITKNGYRDWTGRHKVDPGPEAWKSWLEMRYQEGAQQELPLCLLIALYSDEQAPSGTSKYEQLRGVGETTLQNEFQRVLKKPYPKFEI